MIRSRADERRDREITDELQSFKKHVRPMYNPDPFLACQTALSKMYGAADAFCHLVYEIIDEDDLRQVAARVDCPESGPHTMAAHVSAAVTERFAQLRKRQPYACEVCGVECDSSGLCAKHLADVSQEERSSW